MVEGVLPSPVFSTMVEELLSSEEARSPSSGLFFCFLLCFFLGVLEPPGSSLLEGGLCEGVHCKKS
jgi:hypothetical protein